MKVFRRMKRNVSQVNAMSWLSAVQIQFQKCYFFQFVGRQFTLNIRLSVSFCILFKLLKLLFIFVLQIYFLCIIYHMARKYLDNEKFTLNSTLHNLSSLTQCWCEKTPQSSISPNSGQKNICAYIYICIYFVRLYIYKEIF